MSHPPQYWMVKQEPDAYSWDDFVRDGSTAWTGVRNFQARNNLRAMLPGDQVLFYHSVSEKAVVGIAEVTEAAFPDPTAEDGKWDCVRLRPLRPLPRTISLEEIKAEATLRDIALVRQSRLSVLPLAPIEFETIVAMSAKQHRLFRAP